eukprot:augustus_masked-scaffold_3-processed-gene-10.7-mRNA-1 protein AED:0.02 eAED:0.03 QI:0/-1/0/1/-1/1/1/0/638
MNSCKSSLPKDVTLSDSPDDYTIWHQILSPPLNNTKSKAFLREFLSGFTVALAQVPEAVAFAFTAGVDPIVGLQAAWIICLITALFGGAPGSISGATGAIAVVLPEFVEEHGVGFLFITIIIMGMIEIVLGLVGVGKLVRLIGAPVMIGFCNGLAIVIFLAQFHSFKHECEANYDGPFKGCWLEGDVIAWQCGIILVTMLTIVYIPKLTKSFPPSLAGIIVGTILEFAVVRPVGNETPLVEDLASVKGTFPKLIWFDDQYSGIPNFFEANTWSTAFPTALTLAVIGLVESLLTMQLVSEITRKKSSAMKECLAQGVANVVVGMFGGMGGCAMIGQSMINVKSGGVTRISSSVAGIFLLVIILAAYKLINLIPTASLAGVMFMVVIGTFDWGSLQLMFHSALPLKYRKHPKLNAHQKIKRADALVIAVVTIVAVLVNLAVAVAAGVLLSAVFFSWDQKDVFEVKTFLVDVETEDNKGEKPDEVKKIYRIHGPLFFGTAQEFEKSFDAVEDPKMVEVHLENAHITDYSALASLNKIANRYKEQEKVLVLKNVQPQAMKVIRKAKHIMFVYDMDQEEEKNEEYFEAMEIDPKFYDAAHVRYKNSEEAMLKLDKKEEEKTDVESRAETASTKSEDEKPLSKV